MLHIQGDLQVVFDALYEMGVIGPVLKMDWHAHLANIENGSPELFHAIDTLNACGRDRSLITSELKKLDSKELEILAMEVAREFAEFHARESLQ